MNCDKGILLTKLWSTEITIDANIELIPKTNGQAVHKRQIYEIE